MEENKKNEINTEQAGSGGLLYGTEPAPQEERQGTSALYGTETKQPETMEAQPVLAAFSKEYPQAGIEQPVGAVSQSASEPADASVQPAPVQLTKRTESSEIAVQPALVQLTKVPESAEVPVQPVQLTKAPESAEVPVQPVQLTKAPESAEVPVQPVQLTEASNAAGDMGTAKQSAPTNPVWPIQQTPQGAYDQQGASQTMNYAPMGFGPVQTPPPIQGAPALKPQKRRNGLVAGILCVAAVLIVIVVSVMLSKILLGGGAKAQLAKGFANMAKEMAAYQSSIAEDIGLTSIHKIKEERPIHTNIDVSFTDPNAEGSFSNLDLEIDSVTDYKEKMGEYEVRAGTYGFDMNIGNIVAADNTLYITVPLMLKDKVYSLDLTNLGKDFNNSAWSELLGEELPEEYAVTLFESPNTAANIKDVGVDSELYKIVHQHFSAVANTMTFDKIKEKKTFAFDGADTAYGGVRLTVDKDAYNEAAEGIRDAILASDFYEESKKGYQSIYGISYGEKMDMAVECMFDIRFEQDIILDFYLDQRGRIVNLSTPEDIAVSGEYSQVESLAVDIDFSGSERALDSIEGGVYMQADDEILCLGISRSASVTEECYNEDLTFRLQGDNSDEEITFCYTNAWGYEDKTFDMQMALETEEDSIGLRADGSFMDIVKGEGYTFQIDHAAISFDQEDMLLMTGSIMMEPVENRIEVPKDAENILEMTSSDIQELFYGALF